MRTTRPKDGRADQLGDARKLPSGWMGYEGDETRQLVLSLGWFRGSAEVQSHRPGNDRPSQENATNDACPKTSKASEIFPVEKPIPSPRLSFTFALIVEALVMRNTP